MEGFYRAAKDGLQLDGEEAYLIPYGKEATYIKGYKGIIKQLMRAGATDAFAEVVFSRDHCVIDYGNRAQPLLHQIALTDRGDPLGAYGAIQLPGRGLLVHYMSADDIDNVRQHAPGKDSKAWKERPLEMWRKTALRNTAKYAALLADEPYGDDAEPPADPLEAAHTVQMFSRSATSAEAEAVMPTDQSRAQMADVNQERQDALKPYRLFLDTWRAHLTSDQLNAIATHVTGNYCALLPTTPVATLLAGHTDLTRWHAWLEAQEPVLLETASAHALVDAYMTREEVSA